MIKPDQRFPESSTRSGVKAKMDQRMRKFLFALNKNRKLVKPAQAASSLPSVDKLDDANEIKKIVDKFFIVPDMTVTSGSPGSASSDQMDKLIYEMVGSEKEKEIRNHFETAVLKTMQLKTKLDKKIDEWSLALQVLKNLRTHIENAHNLAKQVVNTNGASYDTRSYVISQLDTYNKQIEKTLHYNLTSS